MRRVFYRLLLTLAVLAGAALVTLIATLMFGSVYGTEFAPDTFERRSYFYYELPVVRLQVTPVQRVTSRSTLEQALIDRKYVQPINPPKRWDLIRAYRVNGLWRQGDAEILAEYLDVHDDKGPHWLEWSDREPKLAAIFWPEVAKQARAELYILMPDLFELAAQSTDPAKFTRDLQLLLARKYEELADVETALENPRAAERFHGEAVKLRITPS